MYRFYVLAVVATLLTPIGASAGVITGDAAESVLADSAPSAARLAVVQERDTAVVSLDGNDGMEMLQRCGCSGCTWPLLDGQRLVVFGPHVACMILFRNCGNDRPPFISELLRPS
jgi:hypothetical protein